MCGIDNKKILIIDKERNVYKLLNNLIGETVIGCFKYYGKIDDAP